MIAAQLIGYGAPDVLSVRSVEDPAPGTGELLVRVEATSVNAHDLRLRRGEVGYAVDLPTVPGIDVCGTVVAIGAGVGNFAVGDRIVNAPWVMCGSCPSCLRGRSEFCTGGYVFRGGYAELALVPARIAAKVDSEMPATLLACLPNAYVTAWQMLVTKAHVGPGDVVFVWAGTSGLGSAAVEIARLAGATVVTSAGSPDKLDTLRGRGADLSLNHHSDDVVARVMEFSCGLGATIVFEQIGSATFARSLAMCAPGGLIVSAGATSGASATINIQDLYHAQRRITGSRTGSVADLLAILRHARAGHFDPLIDSVIPLSKVAHAHHRLETGSVTGKIVVQVSGANP